MDFENLIIEALGLQDVTVEKIEARRSMKQKIETTHGKRNKSLVSGTGLLACNFVDDGHKDYEVPLRTTSPFLLESGVRSLNLNLFVKNLALIARWKRECCCRQRCKMPKKLISIERD